MAIDGKTPLMPGCAALEALDVQLIDCQSNLKPLCPGEIYLYGKGEALRALLG